MENNWHRAASLIDYRSRLDARSEVCFVMVTILVI